MKSITNRITHGWNVRRILYALLGIYAIVEGIKSSQWILVPLGLYFLIMGVFSIGCAGNNCNVDTSNINNSNNKTKNNNSEILNYEEIK